LATSATIPVPSSNIDAGSGTAELLSVMVRVGVPGTIDVCTPGLNAPLQAPMRISLSEFGPGKFIWTPGKNPEKPPKGNSIMTLPMKSSAKGSEVASNRGGPMVVAVVKRFGTSNVKA
jgi:hypothetical protein